MTFKYLYGCVVYTCYNKYMYQYISMMFNACCYSNISKQRCRVACTLTSFCAYPHTELVVWVTFTAFLILHMSIIHLQCTCTCAHLSCVCGFACTQCCESDIHGSRVCVQHTTCFEVSEYGSWQAIGMAVKLAVNRWHLPRGQNGLYSDWWTIRILNEVENSGNEK